MDLCKADGVCVLANSGTCAGQLVSVPHMRTHDWTWERIKAGAFAKARMRGRLKWGRQTLAFTYS